MNIRRIVRTGAGMLFGLLGLPGRGPSKGQRAIDAFNRGLAHYNDGENDLAIAAYAEAIRLNPKDAGAYYFRGLVQAENGETAGAEADFAKARQLGYEPE
jgi:Flp pilus assembly protein TadD